MINMPLSKRLGILWRTVSESRRIIGILGALLTIQLVLKASFPPSITPVAVNLLAVLAGMLVIWLTEAVDYSTSSFMLIGLMTLLIAACPDPHSPGKTIGTKTALSMALSGFGSEAWILVTAALILAAAIVETRLGERLAYLMLLVVGPKSGRVLAGILALGLLLSIFVPSQVANAALLSTISVEIIELHNISRKDNFAKALLLLVAFGTGIAGMGIQTSGAPTIQAARYLSQAGYAITWLQWACYGVPFSLASCTILYLLVRKHLPTGTMELPGGRAGIRRRLDHLGPLSKTELKLLVIMLATTVLWSTETHLHHLDSATVAVLAVMALFSPGIAVSSWDRLVRRINWGVLMLFGAAMSLGQWLLKSQAADWVAEQIISAFSLREFPLLLVIGISVLLFSLMSLTFSARAAAVAALVPAAIGLARGLSRNGAAGLGLALVLYYAIQFSIILPVNTPMSMIAYSTQTFRPRDMIRLGIPLVLLLMMLILVFSATYWHWLGIV